MCTPPLFPLPHAPAMGKAMTGRQMAESGSGGQVSPTHLALTPFCNLPLPVPAPLLPLLAAPYSCPTQPLVSPVVLASPPAPVLGLGLLHGAQCFCTGSHAALCFAEWIPAPSLSCRYYITRVSRFIYRV